MFISFYLHWNLQFKYSAIYLSVCKQMENIDKFLGSQETKMTYNCINFCSL